jgi:hypothetical protein
MTLLLSFLGALTTGLCNTEPEQPVLLIVAPHKFEEALVPYMEHKRTSIGVSVAVLESVLTIDKSGDDPEKLKRVIPELWEESQGTRHPIRYVLLVGDADIMPVRYMCLDRNTDAAFNYAFYPSDLYYADLIKPNGDFEDWNGNKDDFHAGYFGEVRGEYQHDQLRPHQLQADDRRWSVAGEHGGGSEDHRGQDDGV